MESTTPPRLRRGGVVDGIEMSDGLSVHCVDTTDVVAVDTTNVLAAHTKDVLSVDATDVMLHTQHMLSGNPPQPPPFHEKVNILAPELFVLHFVSFYCPLGAFFSSRRRHTRSLSVSWARRCV